MRPTAAAANDVMINSVSGPLVDMPVSGASRIPASAASEQPSAHEKLDTIDEAGIARLVKNDTKNFLLVNLWATWCGPCVADAPVLKKIYEAYRDKGLEILGALRGHTTGYATPMFVIDAPGGGGKIQLSPDPIVGREGDDLLLRNFEGRVYRYPDPGGTLGQNAGQ